MSENIVKPSGPTKASKNDAGGGVLRSEPVMAVVKNNIDPVRMGRIQVAIEDLNGPDPEDSSSWVTVGFLSPFYGRSYPNGGDSSGYGDYLSNPVSYGEWHSPPEIGTRVICVFVNGDPNYGYYIGSIPEAEALSMVPAIGAVDSKVVLNAGEAKGLAGATQLPVTNLNINNSAESENNDFLNMPKPVHSYVATILSQQGLIRDNIRGPITSSAQRETPSRVGWGVSTPGRPVYEGGQTDQTIAGAASGGSNAASTKIIGRRAGHTFVMDDGDLLGKDQLIRLRTSLGHQILMSDDGQCLFIIHANGQSWIELGKEGTIDMFATNSVNVRTQGDLNLHADNNININADKNLNINAKENININSTKEMTVRNGTDFKHQVLNNFTTKAGGAMSMGSAGEGSYAAGGTMYINGSVVNLNTGSTSLPPPEVTPIPLIAQTDTLFDSEKGFAPAPAKLQTIVSRAPTHMPWPMAGQGVDVKVNLDSSAALPSAPSPAVQAANNVSPALPEVPSSVATMATVPNISTAGTALDASSTAALVGAAATQAGSLATQAVSAGTAITDGVAQVGQLAQTATQMTTGGALKPGADTLVNSLISSGSSVTGAMTNNLFTGQAGASSLQEFVNSTTAQVQSQVTNFTNAQTTLTSAGILTGSENPGAVAGVVMAAAQNGVVATADFIKNAASGTTTALTQAGSNLSGIAQNISAGNFASNLSSNITGGLSGIASSLGSALDKAQGAVTSAFNSIVGAYKSFKPNVPQDLKAIASAATDTASTATTGLAASASGITNSLTTAATSAATLATATTGLQGLQGGISTLGATVNNAVGAVNTLPGSNIISTAINNTSTSVMNGISAAAASATSTVNSITGGALSSVSSITGGVTGAVNNLTSGLSGSLSSITGSLSSAGSLLASATSMLPKNLAAQLNSAIGALSATGPGSIKMPVIATNTVDRSSITSQITSILGNPKIPAPNFSLSVASYYETETKKLQEQQAAKAVKQKLATDQFDVAMAAKSVYQDAINNLPEGDPGIASAREKFIAEKTKWYDLVSAALA